MRRPGGPPFSPGEPPIGDDEAMRAWWEQLERGEGEGGDSRSHESAPREQQAAEPPPTAAAASERRTPAGRRGLFAGLSRDELARAFVLGEVLGPPRSRRGRR